MKTWLSFFILVAVLVLGACENSSENHTDQVDSAKQVNKEVKPVQRDASDFAVNAAKGGMMEIILGKIAQENASSPRIIAFGEMMVKDHTDANGKLKNIASTLNIALPDSVSKDDQKEIDHLKMKKGKEFDKMYVHMMVDDHKKDITQFRQCADKCSDSSIKAFAYNTLPVLKKHLDSIQAIAGK